MTVNLADQKAADALAAEQHEESVKRDVEGAIGNLTMVTMDAGDKFMTNEGNAFATFEQVYNKICTENSDSLARMLAASVVGQCIQAARQAVIMGQVIDHLTGQHDHDNDSE